MSDKLNIRAAKALGFKYIRKHKMWLIPEEHQEWSVKNCRTMCGGFHLEVEWFKFDKSYDWAMLGVKACNLSQYDRVNKIIFYGGQSVRDKPSIPTPEQITQAWVEVLEAHDA